MQPIRLNRKPFRASVQVQYVPEYKQGVKRIRFAVHVDIGVYAFYGSETHAPAHQKERVRRADKTVAVDIAAETRGVFAALRDLDLFFGGDKLIPPVPADENLP